MGVRVVHLLGVLAAVACALPLGPEGAATVALVDDGEVPYMRSEVKDFKSSLFAAHQTEGEVGTVLDDDFAVESEESKTLADLEADDEDLGESEHDRLGEPKDDDYEKNKEQEEDADLSKAEEAAKAAEQKNEESIKKMRQTIKTQATIKKMTEETQKTINDAMKGLDVNDENSSPSINVNGEDSSPSTSKKLGEGQHDVQAADSDNEKEYLMKLTQQETQLKQNLNRMNQDMSSLENNFSKGHEDEIKLEKNLKEFKKASQKAKKLAKPDDTSPMDELGEDSAHDYGHEMDELVHLSQDQPTGLTHAQARHLEADYHRVAAKYLTNVEKIMIH